MTAPPPLPGDIVNLTLHYLLPPVAPLPPHLISRELLQRHHFLNIDPSDTELYFCWPSSRSSDPLESPIHALELLGGNKELLEKSRHSVTYDSDSETSRAFVQVGDNVQVIFVWQDVSEGTLSMDESKENGWRFHGVRRSISKALASSFQERPNDSVYGDDASRDDSSRSSSPSYWDSYTGMLVSDSPVISHRSRLHTDAQESLEDAYWNLYSTVQGTADSTIPSPRLDLKSERRRRPDNFESRVSGVDNISFDACQRHSAPEAEYCGLSSEYRTLSLFHPQEAGINSHGAEMIDRVLCNYKPEQCTEKVESHATRLSRALLPLLSLQGYIEKNPPPEEPSSSDSVDDCDALEVARTSLPSPPRNDQSAASMETEEPQSLNQSSSDAPLDEVEKAVVESVQGLYKLWISSNQRFPTERIIADDRAPRKAFLSLVQRALH